MALLTTLDMAIHIPARMCNYKWWHYLPGATCWRTRSHKGLVVEFRRQNDTTKAQRKAASDLVAKLALMSRNDAMLQRLLNHAGPGFIKRVMFKACVMSHLELFPGCEVLRNTTAPVLVILLHSDSNYY